MPYADINGVEYWVNPREATLYNQRDPFHRAAEQFACDVEEYLYREFNSDGTVNPAFQNPDFLAWATARYDATRSGSGHPWHKETFDPDRVYRVDRVTVNKVGRNFEGEIVPEEPVKAKKKRAAKKKEVADSGE